MSKNLWFKRKTYGWGWTPASWQGWAVTGAIVAAMLVPTIGGAARSTFFYLYQLGCIALLMVICLWKGEKPQWQWGKK